jgi:choline-glycine betaine transporter
MIPRGIRRAAFIAYALVIVTLTHWPRLQVEGPLPRLDLWAHFVAFSLWMILFAAAAFFGDTLSRRNLTRATPIACVYVVLDELTQGIPGLGRVVDPLDIVANLGGIAIGVGALVLARRTVLRFIMGTPSRREP